MSFRAVTWAMDEIKGLGVQTKFILVALAEYAGEHDTTWRSVADIAERAECSQRSVSTHLKRLEEAGLISRTARYMNCARESGPCAARGPHKHRATDLYTLHLDRRYTPTPVALATDVNVAGTRNFSTPEKFAGVEETVESCGKVHTCKNCRCEATPESARRSHRKTASGITKGNKPPIEPPNLTRPKESTDVAREDASGRVGNSRRTHL